jgi:hypothetical protein
MTKLNLDSIVEMTLVRGGDAFRSGRSVRDGHFRGVGLQFGELRSLIYDDPLYKDALALAGVRTIQSELNRMNLYLLLKYYVSRLGWGHVVEFGSYKGGSAIFMAKVCSVLYPGMKVFAFDTFSGMPSTDSSIDAHRAGDFKDVDFNELESYISAIGLDNLVLVPGLFEESVPKTFHDISAIRLAHIDCDIRSAVEYSYNASRERIVAGGYYVFDDALFSSCLGATEAVEDCCIRRDGLNSEQIFPHFVFRAPI